ncbi:MAG: ABC transporter permease [SAR324 cluster bacterium]|nr:ABC transporter permease [SAR324 cluster bacterium]MBL7034558.1 ABC transporter permease [SAR324 cluster bacterium]
MSLGENTALLSLLPLIGAAVVLFRKGFTEQILGKTTITLLVAGGCLATLNSVHLVDSETISWGFWLYVVSILGLIWKVMGLWSNVDTRLNKKMAIAINLLVPLLFGGMLLYLWEIVTVGFQVPQVLLPSPSLIGVAFVKSMDTLWADFQQTFMKAVLAGFFLGCGSGFFVAILVDKVPFLQRGLLPLGNLASALPIVGVAPIMVMWFGFDWQSKAAVVVMMTFFPMLVNTLTGLRSTERMELDMMHSYAADYWQMFLKVRLPNALPFIFNALKINSTLALIGAIVAEFFGTPIVGMGFRISTEIGRMNVDVVWASIAVAALSGSLFYALLAFLERQFTGWHPSFRVG